MQQPRGEQGPHRGLAELLTEEMCEPGGRQRHARGQRLHGVLRARVRRDQRLGTADPYVDTGPLRLGKRGGGREEHDRLEGAEGELAGCGAVGYGYLAGLGAAGAG